MVALISASVVFLAVLVIFSSEFTNAAQVTSALSTLFAVFGTVVGAYFGIKLSSDTVDKTAKQLAEEGKRTERANEAARTALRER